MTNDNTILILYEIGLLVIISSIASELFRRAKLPPLIGAIVVGIFIGGPGGVGLVNDLTTVNVLATLGAVLILFTIGLEFETSAFWKAGRKAFLLTTFGVVGSVLAGYVLGLTLGWSNQAAFLLGVVLAPSGTSVIAVMLSAEGKVESDAGSTLLTACIVDDVEGVLLLTFALGVVTSGRFLIPDLVWIAFISTFFIVASIYVGGRVFPILIMKFERFLSEEVLFAVLLGSGLVLAFVATQFGLAAITGAFIMGAIIPYRRIGEKIAHRLFLMKEIFAAIFFTSIGLSINPFDIPQVLPVAMLALGLAVGARMIGGVAGAALGGFRGRTLLTLALALTIRGEMSLIIAREGLALGIVGEEFLGLATTAVLGSMIMALPLYSRLGSRLR